MPRNRVTRALRIARLAHSLGDYDSNVLGMVGEVIAEDVLRMTKAPKQSRDIDGYVLRAGVTQSVQVKALSTSRIATYGGGSKFRIASGTHPQVLVVLLVRSKTGQYEVLYDGPAQTVGKTEVVAGVQRRGVRVADLFLEREAALQELVRSCRGDA